jgi:hypothetical protein
MGHLQRLKCVGQFNAAGTCTIYQTLSVVVNKSSNLPWSGQGQGQESAAQSSPKSTPANMRGACRGLTVPSSHATMLSIYRKLSEILDIAKAHRWDVLMGCIPPNGKEAIRWQ